MPSLAQEKKIADDYIQELDDLFSQLGAEQERGSAGRPIRAEIVRQLNIYERHVSEMLSLFADRTMTAFYESMIHFYRGRLALFGEDFLGDLLVGSTRKATEPGETLLLGYLAGKQLEHNFRQCARNAIAQYDQAIAIYDNEFFRMNRARLHHGVEDEAKALADVEVVLQNPESSYYTNARKLKYEIEQSQAAKKKKGDCFIATAVYGSPDAPEVQFLRHYRDATLVHSWLGRRFVAAYYRLSPPLAHWLASRPGLCKLIRARLFDPGVTLLQRRVIAG